MGEVEQGFDALINAGQGHPATTLFSGDIEVHQHAQAGGIHVLRLAEIEDGKRWLDGAKLRLEIEHVAQGKRANQFDDQGAFAGGFFDGVCQWTVVHETKGKEAPRPAD